MAVSIKKIFYVFLFLLVGALAGCSQGTPVISIDSAEARLSPVFSGAASIFMKITNSGNGADLLVGCVLDIPNTTAEFHDMKDGKMVRVESIAIPSNAVTALRPASLHIMVFKMPKEIKEGHQFTVRLNFKKSGPKTVLIRIAGASNHLNKTHGNQKII